MMYILLAISYGPYDIDHMKWHAMEPYDMVHMIYFSRIIICEFKLER